jgi:2,5-furandicarboxylate decarboxylase 1
MSYYPDLRAYLDRLDAEGQLVRIKKEVDPAHELSAVLRHVRDRPVYFERVKGSSMPAVGNVFANYRTIEVAFDTDRDQLLQEYVRRVEHRHQPVLVDDGPVRERVVTGDDVDLRELPVPTINAKDAGPYIDAGVIVANDPVYGGNLSIQRIQVTGARRAGIWIAPMMHLEAYRQRAEEQGKALDIAVVIGADPSLYLASQVYASAETDEYEMAGAIRGAGMPVVQCETVDLRVPAAAEIVLEGRILPHVREPEGPFGEFTGYYGSAGDRPVVEFTGMMTRRQPLFQTIYLSKPPTEDVFIKLVPKCAALLQLLKQVVPDVRDVYLTPGGCGKYHAVASIRKRHDGEGKQALMAMLASHLSVKHAVVVDEDIDIHDPHDVEWAVATRSQFDADSVVVTGTPHNLDPSVVKHWQRNLTTKVGVDATLPLDGSYPDRCDVLPEALLAVQDDWESYEAFTTNGRFTVGS